MTGTPKQYFPIMKVADIVHCLEALDVRVQETDIQKPQPNTVLQMFESLADILMNIQYGTMPDPLNQDPEIVDRILEDTTDHPELHRESLSTMIFFRQVSKVMHNIGVRSFCLKDLTHPDPGRIKMLLSAIINFARFREERLQLFEELTEETDKLVQIKNGLSETRDATTENINSIKLQRTEEQPEVERLATLTEKMATALRELKASGDGINSSVSNLKMEKAEVQESLKNVELALEQCKQETDRLKSRIVKNPEQLRRVIQDMNTSFQSLKAAVSAGEKQARESETKVGALKSVECDISAALLLVQECVKEHEEMGEAEARVAAARDALGRKNGEARELRIREQQLHRQETVSKEKLCRLQLQIQAKQESTANRLRKFRDEWNALGEDDDVREQIDEYVEQISELKSKIQDLKNNADIETQATQNDISVLKGVLHSYMTDLKLAMNEVDEVAI